MDPVLPDADFSRLVACCTTAEGPLKRRYLSPPYYKKRKQLHSPLTARSIGKHAVEQEVQVGPTLGIAKSSSLESLQTALESLNDDGAFLKAQPRVSCHLLTCCCYASCLLPITGMSSTTKFGTSIQH